MKKVKKPLLLLLIFSITLGCNRSNPSSQTTKATDSAIENRIKSMSIEQKVGQMTQINLRESRTISQQPFLIQKYL